MVVEFGLNNFFVFLVGAEIVEFGLKPQVFCATGGSQFFLFFFVRLRFGAKVESVGMIV